MAISKRLILKKAVYLIFLVLFILYGLKIFYNCTLLLGKNSDLKMRYLCKGKYWDLWNELDLVEKIGFIDREMGSVRIESFKAEAVVQAYKNRITGNDFDEVVLAAKTDEDMWVWGKMKGNDTLSVVTSFESQDFCIIVSEPANQKERELIALFDEVCIRYEKMLCQILQKVLPTHLLKLLIWCMCAGYLLYKKIKI